MATSNRIMFCMAATPFTEDGSLDEAGLRAHLRRLVAAGNGIYLGSGLVITAAHVIGWAFWNKPKVEIAGKNLSTKVVKEGSLNSLDVSLVSVEEAELPVSLRLRRLNTWGLKECVFLPTIAAMAAA